jgi:deazaflavin-dependent oxidoreductase (nitroreductase family)
MPLGCFALGEGRFAIVASNGGSSAHPDWYYNLKANPRVNVEVGTETFTVLAEELDGTARAGLWPRLVTDAPSLGEYQARTARQIPVFMLTPVSRSVLGFWPARERARVGRASRAVGRSRRRWRPDRAAQGSRSPCTQLVFGAAAYVASMTTC